MAGSAPRPQAGPFDHDFVVGDWLVQPSLYQITKGATTTRLEPKQMQVLIYLAEHAGEVITKEQLISAVWADTFVTDQVLTNAIWELRQAFALPRGSQFIQTIPKGGYRLTAPVKPLATPKQVTSEPEAESGAADKSLAVLYFDKLGGQPDDDYFRDGITEDITTELSRIKDLRVLSRSAVLSYRDKEVTPYAVGRALGVRYVVEGSLRRDGDRLRAIVKLVETKTAHTLWAERYDRGLQDVFAIQEEIAKNVATALRVVLTEHEQHMLSKVPTADVRAYDFYLQGRHFFHQFRRRGLGFAREMFARAIELDPTYARAWAGTAYCSAFLNMFWESKPEHLEQAEQASRKALELDPDLAEAHTARGLVHSLKKEYDTAQEEFELAIRLHPKLFEPYYFRGRNAYTQGRLEQAVYYFEQASRVLPEDYQAPMLMASALHGVGRLEEARIAYRRGLGAAEKHLEIHPEDARALYFGANALTQLGDKEKAFAWAERALKLEPDEHQVLYNVACVYALLGEVERSIDCLEKSITRGWGQREWMAHDPDLASVRDHPRFQKLLREPLQPS